MGEEGEGRGTQRGATAETTRSKQKARQKNKTKTKQKGRATYLSWCKHRWGSRRSGTLSLLGFTQRMNCGCVLSSCCMRECICSLNRRDTVTEPANLRRDDGVMAAASLPSPDGEAEPPKRLDTNDEVEDRATLRRSCCRESLLRETNPRARYLLVDRATHVQFRLRACVCARVCVCVRVWRGCETSGTRCTHITALA